MVKKAISKKPAGLPKNTPPTKGKSSEGLISINPAKRLKDKDLIFKALWQCLIENDVESFKDILRGHLEALSKERLAEKSSTSRRTIYRILSPEGNPTLKNISKVLNALYG